MYCTARCYIQHIIHVYKREYSFISVHFLFIFLIKNIFHIFCKLLLLKNYFHDVQGNICMNKNKITGILQIHPYKFSLYIGNTHTKKNI